MLNSALIKAESSAATANVIQLAALEIVNGDTVVKLTVKDSLFRNAPAENPILTNEQKKRKILAGFLSFPFPLGFLGAHRIMMGTQPWVPIAYVATFGGCFGILPLVDFCVILFSDNIEQYENNPNIFMWIK